MRGLRRAAPLLMLLAAFAAFALLGGLEAVRSERLIDRYFELKALVEGHPGIALLVFILVYATLVSLVIFPAAFALTMTGGLLFGTILGATASVVGVTAGGIVSFVALKSAFSDRLVRLLGRRGEAFRDALVRDGLLYLLVLRTTPGLPFFIVTVAAAAAHLRFRAFVIATLVGVIPPCLVFANVGATAAEILDRGEALSPGLLTDRQVLLPLAILAGFGVLGIALKHWARRRAGLAEAD